MGKFIILPRGNGRYQFDLLNHDGQSILHNEGYRSKLAVLKGIESVKKNAGKPERYFLPAPNTEPLMFQLKATNGQVIGVSDAYTDFAVMAKDISLIQEQAPLATVDDLTL